MGFPVLNLNGCADPPSNPVGALHMLHSESEVSQEYMYTKIYMHLDNA